MKTNSRQQKVCNEGEFLLISLKSKPENNKANKELIRLIQKKLKISSDQIYFISGLKNRHKTIQIKFKDNTNLEEINKNLLT